MLAFALHTILNSFLMGFACEMVEMVVACNMREEIKKINATSRFFGLGYAIIYLFTYITELVEHNI